MNRITLDIQGLTYELPLNPIGFQWQYSFQNFSDYTINSNSVRYVPYEDSRLRVMTWRNLPNKYPYTHMVSGLKRSVGVSGVRMKYRDLEVVGDRDEWVDIFAEDARITYRKGSGPHAATNGLAYDIDFIFSLR